MLNSGNIEWREQRGGITGNQRTAYASTGRCKHRRGSGSGITLAVSSQY
jgi:hypothetical protein